jgi:hypothetical protein
LPNVPVIRVAERGRSCEMPPTTGSSAPVPGGERRGSAVGGGAVGAGGVGQAAVSQAQMAAPPSPSIPVMPAPQHHAQHRPSLTTPGVTPAGPTGGATTAATAGELAPGSTAVYPRAPSLDESWHVVATSLLVGPGGEAVGSGRCCIWGGGFPRASVPQASSWEGLVLGHGFASHDHSAATVSPHVVPRVI